MWDKTFWMLSIQSSASVNSVAPKQMYFLCFIGKARLLFLLGEQTLIFTDFPDEEEKNLELRLADPDVEESSPL